MGKSLEGRLEDLERRSQPPGKIIVCYANPWDGYAADRDVLTEEEARKQAGPNDTIIVIEYVENWRGGDARQS